VASAILKRAEAEYQAGRGHHLVMAATQDKAIDTGPHAC
jgi:hypothetical protein